MNLGSCHHHCNKEAVLIHNNMTLMSFTFLLTNSIQRLVITSFNTLSIYYTNIGIHVLIPFYSYMTT